MVERIKWTMSHYNLTAAQFADQIGVQRSAVSHVLSGRNNPSLDFLIKIKRKFPAIHFEWLALGDGEPVADSNVPSSETSFQEGTGSLTSHKVIKQQPELDFVPAKPTDGQSDAFVTKESDAVKGVIDSGVKGLIRVVLLYSDGSFESYATRK